MGDVICKIFEQERDALLDERLNKIGSYDLERLRKCLQYEHSYNIEWKSDIENILLRLDLILQARGE